MAAAAKPVYSVQVRELVEFVWRRGDLGGGGAFAGSNRALEGTRGHQRIQRSRPTGYQKEVPVGRELDAGEFMLRIQGRIDGLLPADGTVLLEEIKTVRPGWDRSPDPLHWAQARIYAAIHAQDNALASIAIQLTYLDLETGETTEFREDFSIADLSAFLEETVTVYVAWIREEHRWRGQRDESIRGLAFPYSGYRPGQRELAVAAYRTLARGGRLFLEAPTGIGKTISVLFPAIKAMGEGELERIFYLTARTPGRTVAEQALADLRGGGLRFRSLTLTAREKVCVRDGHPCDVQTCPLAKGYYDRIRPALRAGLNREDLTRPVIEEVGRQHQVCPFELSLDLSSWADGVVCDYNYVFDPKVYLRRHFETEGGAYGFLVDEAHNLPDRAREMFSADLQDDQIQTVRRSLRSAAPHCAKALQKLSSALRKLTNPADSEELAPAPEPDGEPDLFALAKRSSVTPEAAASVANPPRQAERDGVRTSRGFPADIMPCLESALEETETWLVSNQSAAFREALLELFFRLHSFRRTAALYDERYVTIIETQPAIRLRLFCVDPSFLLSQALTRGKAAVFFSATLTPLDYYRSLLGGTVDDPVTQLPSPFPPEHLAVLVHDRIRTDFKARGGTLAEVAQAIGALTQGRPGNYLVYLPAYAYLAAVRDQFQTLFPEIAILDQRPGLSEPEREAFLAAFRVERKETLVGFAVLGGVFGEGIDLVGDHLIGAIIVGVGLPQLCVERDLIRDFFQEKIGLGFEFAYTFPGMNRVLQAIGRVIRTENDRGVALLIDTRFSEPRYGRLFPPWWRPARVRSVGDISEAVRAFWDPLD